MNLVNFILEIFVKVQKKFEKCKNFKILNSENNFPFLRSHFIAKILVKDSKISVYSHFSFFKIKF